MPTPHPPQVQRKEANAALEPSWRDLVIDVFRTRKGPLTLEELLAAIENHSKTKRNRQWRRRVKELILLDSAIEKIIVVAWILKSERS